MSSCRVDPAEAEHQRDDLLALALEVLVCSQTGAREIAHRLVPIVGNPNGGEFTGPQELARFNPSRRFVFTRSPGFLEPVSKVLEP